VKEAAARRSKEMSWVVVPFGLLIFGFLIRVITGYERGSGRVGPPVWQWSEWKGQWTKPQPVSEAVYSALSADEWLTSKQIFEKIPRSVVRWNWEVRSAMADFVRRGYAERHQERTLIRYRKKPDPITEALYNALPADEWVTSQRIFEKVPRSLIRWKWHVRPWVAHLVRRGLAERHQEGTQIRYRKLSLEPLALQHALRPIGC
jgi:hypothetical protein